MPTADFNSGTWKIYDYGQNPPKVVETHPNPKAAQRAALILSAHDMKNGRVANYRVEPTIIIPNTIDELDLPPWAYQIIVGDLIGKKISEAKKSAGLATIGEAAQLDDETWRQLPVKEKIKHYPCFIENCPRCIHLASLHNVKKEIRR